MGIKSRKSVLLSAVCAVGLLLLFDFVGKSNAPLFHRTDRGGVGKSRAIKSRRRRGFQIEGERKRDGALLRGGLFLLVGQFRELESRHKGRLRQREAEVRWEWGIIAGKTAHNERKKGAREPFAVSAPFV